MKKIKYPKTGEFQNNLCECGAKLYTRAIWVTKDYCKCMKCGRDITQRVSEKRKD